MYSDSVVFIAWIFSVSHEVPCIHSAGRLFLCREDYLRAIRALLREIVRALRHDLNFIELCRGLMRERKDATFAELDSSIKVTSFFIQPFLPWLS